MGNKKYAAYVLMNISTTYYHIKLHEKALEYWLKCLEINEEIGSKPEIVTNLVLIGNNYNAMEEHEKALTYYKKAQEDAETYASKSSQANLYYNMGVSYQHLEDFAIARNFYNRALIIGKEISDVRIQGFIFSGLGKVDNGTHNYAGAIKNCTHALEIGQSRNDIEMMFHACDCLKKPYKATGQYQKLVEVYELYSQFKDSMESEENQQAVIQQQFQYEYEKKALADSMAQVEQNMQTELAFQQEIYRKDRTRNILIALGAIMLILAVAFYARNRYVKRTNLELSEARDRLEELDHLKTRLYTNITHEFRTPLTVILGMAGQIKYPPESKTMIQRNSKRLLQLVNQMLDLAKLESGSMKSEMIRADIISYLNYLVEAFQSFAESKSISLYFYPETEHLLMDFDEEKVQTIVSNLLSNAIKFSPSHSKILMHARLHADSEMESDQLSIKVKDKGIGIPAEKLPHVFDRFYQVDGSNTREGEGTGIGLTLTKELVELMGGNISVKSTPGTGSEFTVMLPVTQEAALKEGESAAQIGSYVGELNPDEVVELIAGPKQKDQPILLVIEDNPDVVTYIRKCLQDHFHIEVAENGGKGIEMALQIIPDIIISDVMMPVKDGFEVCAALKSDERSSHIPIILLTAKADMDSRIEGLERGADAYLAKPFEKKELLVRLQVLIKLRKDLRQRYASGSLPAPVTDAGMQMEDAFLQKIHKQIEAHLDDETFGIPQLCKALSISRMQLHRKLKALTDKSSSDYLRSIRLQHAKGMLENTDLTISEIAYSTGFSDPSHFSRAFKKEFGAAPKFTRG